MKNLFLFLFTFLLLVGCSSDDSTPDIIEPPVIENNAVRLRTAAGFGEILTNSEGFTLYFFSKDTKASSNCNDGCAGAWPPFFEANLSLDTGLNASDFGSVTRADGSQQTTFKGWPLYLFSNDAAANTINGDGSGGVWFVAKPDYTVMMASAQLIGRDVDGNETNLTGDYTPGDGETFYLTDSEGNTLYSFINDTNADNNFTADDFANNGVWPIFETSLENIPSVLSAADFGTIDVFGRQQLTYKGWPLYFFGQDVERGDNFGVGFPAPGVWPILNTDIETAPEATPTTAITFEVSNQGASAYVFNGDGLNNAVNPDLTLQRGMTYEFTVNSPGHPFFIKTAQTTGTGDQYNDGVTNNGAGQGTVSFTVPQDAPNTLFYICEFHSPMTGTITIID